MFNLERALQSKKFRMAGGAILMVIGLFITGQVSANVVLDAIKDLTIAYLGAQGFVDIVKANSNNRQ